MLKSFFFFAFCLLSAFGDLPTAHAITRVPTPGTGESSLLYWRYLCRGQPQEESKIQLKAETLRMLSCPSQRWKVRTLEGEDKVIEVVEDAS